MGEWRKAKLDDLGFVGRGKSRHRPRNEPSLFGGKYPFIQTGEIKATDLYITKFEQTYNEKGLSQSKLWEPETLCITIAANIAETAILKIKACFPDSIVGFVANPKKADVRFIKYYIDILKLRMQNISKGTTQDNLSVDKLLSFDFIIPDVKIQNEIASIISSYDDLIENNTRRIEILEEMARMIYREWFVNFRFPGHEKVKMVDSELGKIPEGWEVKKLGDVLEVTRGLSYKGKHLTDSGLPMHNLNSILEGGGYKYAGIKFYNGPYNKKHEVIPGDVIVANTEQTWERVLIGYPAIVPRMLGDKGIYSHHIYRVRPENSAYLTKSFIYFMIWEEGLRDWISRFANGTTINMLPREGLSFPKIPMPPKNLVKEFSEFVEPTLTVMENLFQKNQNLRTTRDLLLPKLILGEIDVEELDINTGQLYAEA